MTLKMPVLKSERLVLRMGTDADIGSIIRYFKENRAYLEPFEPQRPNNFFTPEYWNAELEARQQDAAMGRSLKLFIFQQSDRAQVMGVINFNNIIWGAFHAATLGYSLAAAHQRQGFMMEAGERLIRYGFEVLNLHRIMANYMPHNQRSANVLKRLGFEIEGQARRYLLINGQWQDHVLTSLINPDWQFRGF